MRRAWIAALSCLVLSGCATTVDGTATWPGATLAKAALTATEVPPGSEFDLIAENPGKPDGADGPSSMLSRPEGCANALTNVIRNSGERGPGSAVKYSVSFNGARIIITLLSWNLDLDQLRAAADRCASFEAFFDPDSPGIPITTTELSGLEPGTLAYQQTMKLNNSESSIYMAFQNIGTRAVFGVAFPVEDPQIEAKATLPQTFLDIFAKQVAKIRAS